VKNREERIAFEMMYCQHYHVDHKRGCNIECLKGVDINDVRLPRNPETDKTGQPCLSGHLLEDATAACPHWVRRTREQGEARADRTEAAIKRMSVIGPVVAEWRKKLPIGKSEVIECPACSGRLHLSQAASNGHIHGHCETEACVQWME